MSWRNLRLTDCRASWVHGWNQSIVVHWMRAGKCRALTRREVPMGDRHRMTYRG